MYHEVYFGVFNVSVCRVEALKGNRVIYVYYCDMYIIIHIYYGEETFICDV